MMNPSQRPLPTQENTTDKYPCPQRDSNPLPQQPSDLRPPNIIRQIISRRMRWAGHVARMGEKRKVYRVLVEKPEERDHSDDLSVEGRMGSLCMLGRLDGSIEWMQLAEDRCWWRAVANTVKNLLVLAPRS
jgi:hypothetical protein